MFIHALSVLQICVARCGTCTLGLCRSVRKHGTRGKLQQKEGLEYELRLMNFTGSLS